MGDTTSQQTADATGADSQNSGTDATVTTSAAITFTTEAEFQKRVDDMLKERLERERKKAADAAQKAREEAEQEAAAKNGEWQKLAETHGAKVSSICSIIDHRPKLHAKSTYSHCSGWRFPFPG